MNKNIIITVLTSFLSVFFIILFLILPKAEFSENENRYLTKSPTFSFSSLFSGEYTEDLKNYTTDHFPFREYFMNLRVGFLKLIGENEIDDVYLADNGYLIEKFEGPQNKDRIIRVLNKFSSKLDGVDIDFMLVPTSITINQDILPKYLKESNQLDVIKYYYSNTKLNNIDVYSSLLEGNKKYNMFYKYDHHWTTFGAYYAYLEYCKSNNLTPLLIGDFDIKKVSNDFRGTIYSKILDNSISGEDMYVFNTSNDYTVTYVYSNRTTNTMYEDKYLSIKDKYSYFLDNNHPLITITNNSINLSNNILVIKDSYANSFIPFLTNHYKQAHVIDPRFYNLSISDYIKENSIEKVLILYNVNTIDSDTGILSIY